MAATRYVALGSSMAAGPGINPRAAGAPLRAGRSARIHLVAERLGYDLVDVTYSGATTANALRERQHGAPPQVDVLDGSEHLVTVTIGGNDVGYVPLLFAHRTTAAAPCASCSTLRSANTHCPTSGHRCEKSATQCEPAHRRPESCSWTT